jgi:hypothetical protein
MPLPDTRLAGIEFRSGIRTSVHFFNSEAVDAAAVVAPGYA